MSAVFRRAIESNPIYALTDRSVSGLSHADQVRVLSERGIKVIQLREKDWPAGDFHQAAAAAMEVARERGTVLIVNDRVDIAMSLGADGVHLGQDDLPPEAARDLLGPDAIIGISTHNAEQARRAVTMPVDYIAVGPIFPTASKQSTNKPLGLEGLKVIHQSLPGITLVAIGGITTEAADQILAAGAEALAVISDLWPPRPSSAESA